MAGKKAQDKNKNVVINKLEVTSDTMTGRGGLNLLVKYLGAINIYSILHYQFGWIRKSKKGAAIESIFKQLFCFFIDGTSPYITHFDQLKDDPGYAAIIETQPDEMVSSHQVKRFMKAFPFLCHNAFRFILKHLFVWRLRLECPSVIFLMLDTMVMDNDDALKRQGVSATYKKKKGFQPLHLIWEGKIVDAIFRGGSKHGNSGTAAKNMLVRSIRLIRSQYNETVPIIVRMDSGFFDADLTDLLQPQQIIANHHLRGADELPHRSLKDFASQKLPFQKFNANASWYYCMIMSLFVFESFKEDHLTDLVEVGAYPTTVRRIVIDIAAKIVRKSHYVILKVTRDVMDRLDFGFLWKASQQHLDPIRLII